MDGLNLYTLFLFATKLTFGLSMWGFLSHIKSSLFLKHRWLNFLWAAGLELELDFTGLGLQSIVSSEAKVFIFTACLLVLFVYLAMKFLL